MVRIRPAVFCILLIPVVLILIFAVIYNSLPENSFVRPDDQIGKSGKLPFDEAAYLSVTTQTLLGSAEVKPNTKNARAVVGIQAFTTLLGLLLAAAYSIQTAPGGTVFY